MSIDELTALGAAPRETDPVECDVSARDELTGSYSMYHDEVYQELEKQKSAPKVPLGKLPKDPPPCIKFILSDLSKVDKPNNVTFNTLTVNLINYFKMSGRDEDETLAWCHSFIMDYPYESTYSTQEARLKHFDSQITYLADKANYRFDCSYILGMGFPGNTFNCERCELNTRGIEQDCPGESMLIDEVVPIKEAAPKKDRPGSSVAYHVREYIDSIEGKFTVRDLYDDLGIKSAKDKGYARVTLSRLQKEETIERWKNQAGAWRKISAEVEWLNLDKASVETVDLWLPLDVHEFVKFMPGNIITVAGDANAGKTAFLFNVVKNNITSFKIYYFTSEMGTDELRMRADLFNDFPYAHKNLRWAERADDFADVIRPGKGNINIIDYLELTEDFWIVGKHLKDIHNKLSGALAIVAIQKKHPDSDDALGGKRSLEKPRLALSMSAGKIKILKAKNWKTARNPNNLTAAFKLVQGSGFIQNSDWSLDDTL